MTFSYFFCSLRRVRKTQRVPKQFSNKLQPSTRNMLIFKDIIVQVFYPPKIKREIDKVYASTKDPSKLNIEEFFKTVFEKKTRIPVLITHNEAVAKELFEQTKSLFDK